MTVRRGRCHHPLDTHICLVWFDRNEAVVEQVKAVLFLFNILLGGEPGVYSGKCCLDDLKEEVSRSLAIAKNDGERMQGSLSTFGIYLLNHSPSKANGNVYANSTITSSYSTPAC